VSRAIAVGCALAALSVAACSSKPAAPPSRGGRQALVYTVDVIPVESKKVDYIVQAPGTIDAFEAGYVEPRMMVTGLTSDSIGRYGSSLWVEM